jgi:hypothetical protein
MSTEHGAVSSEELEPEPVLETVKNRNAASSALAAFRFSLPLRL